MPASIINSTTERVSLSSLKRHPRNARKGDVETIRASIRATGFYGSVIVQRSTGFILAGNHRYEAAAQEGLTELDATFVDVDDATARRILAADNGTTRKAGYDEDLLAELLGQIKADSGTLDGTGWFQDELDALLAELPKEATADPSSKLGNLKYHVMIDCESETEQSRVLEKLKGEGIRCRALML